MMKVYVYSIELSKFGIVRYSDIYLKIEELRSIYFNLK